MQGLLDFLQTPAGMGLLSGAASYAAGAGRGGPINSIGRGLLGGIAGYGHATDRLNEQAQLAKRNELWDAQLSSYKADAATKQAELDRRRAQQEALPSLFSQISPGAFSPAADGRGPVMPAEMQKPPSFDVMGAVRAGFTPEQIKQYAELPNAGRAKVARTIERDDGRGGKEIVQVDDFGRVVGDAMSAYIAPVQVNQGDRITMVRPTAGTTLGVNMSPEAKASNALGWANHRQSGELGRGNLEVARGRLALDQQAPKGVLDPERGLLVDPRTGEARPVTMSGQPVGMKMAPEARKELMSINQQRAAITGAINAAQAAPSAFGFWRGMAASLPGGESIAGRFETMDETQARAYVFNNVSRIINERAGAAQSAQELARLQQFLPGPSDNQTQIVNKLNGFNSYLDDLERGTRGQPEPEQPKAPQGGLGSGTFGISTSDIAAELARRKKQ